MEGANDYVYYDVTEKLPSLCKQYEGVEKIEIRTMTGREEVISSEMNLENFDEKFLKILERTVKGISPKDLTLGDRMFLLVWQTINSYTNVIEVKDLICPKCLNESSYPVKIDLSKLEIKRLPEKITLPYELELSNGEKVKLKLLTLGDKILIDKKAKVDRESLWSYYYGMTIIGDEKIEEKKKYFESLPTKDTAKIRAFQTKYGGEEGHTVKLETKYKCLECGGEGVTPIPFRLEYFFPYGDTLINAYGDDI